MKKIIGCVINIVKDNVLATLFVVLSTLILWLAVDAVTGCWTALRALGIVCFCYLWHAADGKSKLHRVWHKIFLVGCITLLAGSLCIPIAELLTATAWGNILDIACCVSICLGMCVFLLSLIIACIYLIVITCIILCLLLSIRR